MNSTWQGVYFTSLPFLAADKGEHALASASGSRGYTSAGTSASREGSELHTLSPSHKGQGVTPKQRIFCPQVPLPAPHSSKFQKQSWDCILTEEPNLDFMNRSHRGTLNPAFNHWCALKPDSKTGLLFPSVSTV